MKLTTRGFTQNVILNSFQNLHLVKTQGFTLIELLVVVLIIGILAAVALPQYRYAVDKSRIMKIVAILKEVKSAQEVYYLEHGKYASDWTQLNISFNGSLSSWNRMNNTQLKTGTLTLLLDANGWAYIPGQTGVVATSTELPYMGFVAFYEHLNNTSWPNGKISCYAQKPNGAPTWEQVNLCKKLTGRTSHSEGYGGWWERFDFK